MIRGPEETSSRGFTGVLLERCISCGFCLAACPTYAQTKDETSSPRGRIHLMRALESREMAGDDPTMREEASFCLGCRACEPVCPAGVQYGLLLEEWRDRLWTRTRRPVRLSMLLWAVNRRWRVRLMGLPVRHAQRADGSGAESPTLMLGCFERVLFPAVSRAAHRLAPELRVDPGQGCCGALHAHNGELERGRRLALELGERSPGTIVTTSGGCAAHLASVLGRDRVEEFSGWLAPTYEAVLPPDGKRRRIALQDSCHLRNGLGGHNAARELITLVGDYVELPSAAACCGAAGTYAILRPRDSRRILDAKLDEIEAARVDIVVTVNAGCMRQLRQGLRRRRATSRVVHLAEILAQAAAP